MATHQEMNKKFSLSTDNFNSKITLISSCYSANFTNKQAMVGLS